MPLSTKFSYLDHISLSSGLKSYPTSAGKKLILSWLLIHLTVYEGGKLKECEHGLILR